MAIYESPHPYYIAHFSAKEHHRRSFSQCSIFRSLAVSDVKSLLLIRQCRFLESTLDLNFTTSVLTSPNSVSPSIKKVILQLDFSLLLSDAASHPSQKLVQNIASSQEGSWPKFWDLALERGVFAWYHLHPSHAETSFPPPRIKQCVPCP